jgi:peptidyl-prolyl cis-trans isomerase B (cyclophilin B)
VPSYAQLARPFARVASTAVIAGTLLFAGAGGAHAAAEPDIAPAHRAPVAAADPPQVTPGPCKYTATPDDPAVRPVRLPRDPARTPSVGTATVDLKTSQGRVRLTLDRAKAPCTVQSFLHLVQSRFYDRTSCHRLTAYPALKVLQCGDPSGTGSGGPGYRYKDELPTDLKPAPNDPTGERRIYPRGTLAMANAGPATNGSQFFLVTSDSVLRPNYTVFGSIDARGLAALDRIAAGGIAPQPENPAPVDGAPALPANIHRALRVC